jgi:hypothetical protein
MVIFKYHLRFTSRNYALNSQLYESLVNLIILFASVVDVLEVLVEEGVNSKQMGEVFTLLNSVQSYKFVRI